MTRDDAYRARAVAVHEAAHFLVALDLGLAPRSSRTDGRGSGVVRLHALPDLDTREGVRGYVVMLLAPMIAEHRAYGWRPLEGTDTSDQEAATAALMRFPADAAELQAGALRAAGDVLRRRWADVLMIAGEIRSGVRAWGVAA
jgi:hypothetical protein